MGPDCALLTDLVCSYDLREAIEVGHILEELDFVWLEEPMHDMSLTSQWLIQGAIDRLRGNARHGTTQVLKLAHLAELHNTYIELNGQGGLFGRIHAHLGCCIDNTDYYEYLNAGGDGLRKAGQQWVLLNAPLI